MTLIPKSVFDAVTTASVVWKGIGDEDSSIRGYGMGWNRQSSEGHEVNHAQLPVNCSLTLLDILDHIAFWWDPWVFEPRCLLSP